MGNTTKLKDYGPNIDEATSDDEGYISVKVEYDYSERTVTTYYLKDGEYVADLTSSMLVTGVTNVVTKADHLGFGLYAPHVEVDVSIKDFKIFKGLGLTVDQLAITENTTPEVEPTSATTRAPIKPVEKTTAAPATQAATTVEEAAGGCGGSLALATVAIVPVIATVAFVSTKKKED